ncbi:GAF domain-containing protein [bacterium]|nr:GAF domain-containing protein [bacterium]MBU3929092.1 GAF domain-containing protein [bacterium]MBU4123841.1 GAF domain-containing protein [bacterium]
MAEVKAQTIKNLKNELQILHNTAQLISSSIEINDVLEQILELVTGLTKADSCLIYLYDKKNNELVLRASKKAHPEMLGKIKLKIGEGITGWVAKEKKPISISSGAYKDKRFKKFANLPEDKYEAFLSIPILSKNEVIGVLNAQNIRKRVYKSSIVELLFTVAKYMGSALVNSLVYGELKKKAEQIELLSEVSRTIVSNKYLEEILHLIVTMTAQVMGSKICSIMLVDEKKQELVIAATQSLSARYKNKPNIRIGQSVSGMVVEEKKAITVLNVVEEPGYMFPEIAGKEGIVSLLSVPMMIKDRVVGVINSYTAKAHRFSAEEISILQAIANQSAAAIESTRLNQDILAAKESLLERKIIERAKGILMKKNNISEEAAYKMMRQKSMDMRKSMKEISQALILASDLDSGADLV